MVAEHAAVSVSSLRFEFKGSERPALQNVNVSLEHGSRCLLIGSNGSGKTTLLSILAGRHMVRGPAING